MKLFNVRKFKKSLNTTKKNFNSIQKLIVIFIKFVILQIKL